MRKILMQTMLAALALLMSSQVLAQATGTTACTAWTYEAIYKEGQCVTYQGQQFKAKWWTQGEAPSATQAGAWQLDAPADADGCVPWTASAVFNAGQCASYNGQNFKAKWWTQGDAPSTLTAGPWELKAPVSPTGCAPWTASAAFNAGQCATYNGQDFNAKWWTQGDVPSTTQAGPWELKSTPDANGCVPWTAGAAFNAGQCVSYNGNTYRAQWWTQGNVPGAQASGPWSLIVANVPPQVTLAVNPATAKAPATITLTAAATDSDGTVTKVEFFNGATLLATVAQAPFAFTWRDVGAGSYSVTAKATDNAGISAMSTPQPVIVNRAEPSTTVYFIETDQINTPRVVTDTGNRLMWRWDSSEPFGSQMVSGTEFKFQLRFPGQYFDPETALHFNYFRDYDPSTGRYVQSDPIGLEGGMNTYLYASGSPVDQIDPDGLQVLRPPLPRNVTRHNEWTDPNRQITREFPTDVDPNSLPLIPQKPKPWCTLRCPSDTPNSCPGTSPPGLPRMSPTGEQCVEVCLQPPFANSDPSSASSKRSMPHQRNASRGDWYRMGRLVLGK